MTERIDTKAVLERMQSIYGCDCIPGRTPGLLHQFRELCAALGQEIADREADQARIEALERRERVGDRMHDFLCRLFSNPRLLPESFAPEAWTLMQDWTAPPPEAALRSEEER